MTSSAFRECLLDIYRGEVLGEAVFAEMLAGAKGPDEVYVIGSLLQFETEGKALVRPVLARLGLSMIESAEGRAQGAGAGAQLGALPWLDRFAAMHETVSTQFLPRYEELAGLVRAEDDPEAARVAAFMGAHERALVAVAANIVAGTADPVAPVAALLHFPLPKPQ